MIIQQQKQRIVFIVCAIFFFGLAFYSANASASFFRRSFDDYVANLRLEALARGISPHVVRVALENIEPVSFNNPSYAGTYHPKINSLADYVGVSVTPKRITKGRYYLYEYHSLLSEISHQFGIPPQLIVALWGLETDYGRLQGNYPEIATLVTMGYKGRRSKMFKSQLFAALRILEKGVISLEDMKGSWAGAMGGCQFMPTTFLAYAIDYTGDGIEDIWHNPADIFASAANYLSHIGWNKAHGVVIAVRVPAKLSKVWAALHNTRSMVAWSRAGVRTENGNPLPPTTDQAALVFPYGSNGQPYLVYLDNYDTIYQWNRSSWYAISIGLLMDKLTDENTERVTRMMRETIRQNKLSAKQHHKVAKTFH